MTAESKRPGVLGSAAALLVLTLLVAACRGTPPPAPHADRFAWVRYTNDEVGFSFEYPDAYTIEEEEDGSGAIFRHDGYPVMTVRHVDPEEADRRGLWADHDPVGETRLAGRAGRRYDYDHSDGPFAMRTVSHVVPYRGKELGLEFRTELGRPDAIQRHVLDSFRIHD